MFQQKIRLVCTHHRYLAYTFRQPWPTMAQPNSKAKKILVDDPFNYVADLTVKTVLTALLSQLSFSKNFSKNAM